ncbi:MAG TPA: bifunctional aldolase/short-chain dehydrogenase [Anaerolineae bacterium]
MQSLLNTTDYDKLSDDIARRVYTSRLLGRDPALVLHGGGNTSVKGSRRNIFGEDEDVLYIKGSGWDLATIEAPGFAPVRLSHLLRLAKLDALSDIDMANVLRLATLDPAAPAPSVEAILHALLPDKWVDHTHADALISLTNTPHGIDHIRTCFGDAVIVIPYVMPGFILAREVARMFPMQRTPQTIGMVLMNHGLFTWGDDARTSYERHIELVSRAEAYLQQHGAWDTTPAPEAVNTRLLARDIAALRASVSEAAGAPMILSSHTDQASLHFARRDDVATISQQGPATPDHVIRTKRVPLLGRDVKRYTDEYRAYFAQNAVPIQGLMMLDPAPRIILDTELGLVGIGRSAKDAAIGIEIYMHTIDIITRADKLDRWQALSAKDIFDMEYWDLEQAKLRRSGKPALFAGEVALVTGAASGIGKACAQSLLARGAAVIGLDLQPVREPGMLRDKGFSGIECDITDETAVLNAIETGVRRFGGIDMLVLNAGIFGKTVPISGLSGAEWDRVMRVNLDANVTLLRESHPLLKLAPRGGRVVIIGSKNVPAPGTGVAAYSASKAALTQLARVTALEWGADHIRINVLHPNQIFDTGLWTEETLKARAAHYGLTVEQYKTNNVLKVEITSRDVGELAAELCGPLFAKTTGAQIPVDGGNDRVI